MSELPLTPASALTRATEQLRGLDLQDDRRPEPPEGPLTTAETERALLGELSAHLMGRLSRRDRLRVWWAVTRGAAVRDQRLAGPAVALAQWRAVLSHELAPVRTRWWSVLPPVAFSPGENGSAPDDRPTTLEQPCPEKPDAS